MLLRGTGFVCPCRGSEACGAWGLAEGDFERRLAMQASAMVSVPQIAGETRRGRAFLQVAIAMTVTAADVGQALVIAWRVFRKAAGHDLGAGWDTASASAEVSPVAASGGEARR